MDSGAERNRYQLILSGELMPGHSLDQATATLSELFTAPPEQLRSLFDGASHRVQQILSADEALELQGRLQQVGVRAHIEKIASREVPLELRRPGRSAGARHAPLPATEASVVRAASEAVSVPRASPAGPAAAAPRPERAAPKQGMGHAEQRWRDAWADSHVEDEPNESERLSVFVGPAAPAYLRRFARVRQDNRPVLRAGWNWGAVLSPFLWALYRKLWGWALVIGMTEVVVPLLLLILAQHGVVPARFTLLAYLSVVANRLFWPAVADYLYFRHCHFSLIRLFRMSPGYASDLDIATAGGVNRSAALVGLAFSGVFALFVWSLVGSMYSSSPDPYETRVPELSNQQSLNTVSPADQVPIDTERSQLEEQRWSTSRRKLRELGQVITDWMAKHSTGQGSSQLTMFRLREDMGASQEAMTDGWGNEIHYLPDNEGYRLISAGPDQLFGTADDILYRRVLAQ